MAQTQSNARDQLNSEWDSLIPAEHLKRIDRSFLLQPVTHSLNGYAFFTSVAGINAKGIGNNFYLYGDKQTRIAVDFGEHLDKIDGYRIVIPDIREFERLKITASFCTHGHVDHFNAAQHFGPLGVDINNINWYAMPEAQAMYKLGAMMGRTPMSDWIRWNCDPSNNCNLDPGGVTRINDWRVEARHIRHSIPSRGLLLTAPNGTKIFHTGDFRLSAGVEEDSDFFEQIMDIGAQADFVVVDVTHAHHSGANKDVSFLQESYAQYFKERIGARINVASLSSALPTIDSFLHEALKAGRTVIFHGGYGVMAAKLFKQAGHSYSPYESELDSDGIPRIMDSEDARCAKIPPENTVVIMTGQYFDENSKFMEFAKGQFKAKYRIPPPNFEQPEKEIFVALRGPYPDMKREWSNMWKGVKYLDQRGFRIDLHGIDNGPYGELRKAFPRVNMVELSAGGHCKYDEAVLFLTLLKEGARRIGKQPPILIPHHTDLRGLDATQDLAHNLRYPCKIILPGQTAGLLAYTDKNGVRCRETVLAKQAEHAPRVIAAKSLGMNDKGFVQAEGGKINIFGGPYQYDLMEWDYGDNQYKILETLVTAQQYQDYLNQVKRREGFSPLTYMYWKSTIEALGLTNKLADFMQLPERKVELRITGEFARSADRSPVDNIVPFTLAPRSSETKIQATNMPKEKPRIRGTYDQKTGLSTIHSPKRDAAIIFNPINPSETVVYRSGQKSVRFVPSQPKAA